MARQEMDGLGDRDRSLSPEGGSAWDTLLASITPDPQPPSAGSSFASASASAAAAATSSASGSASANTSMTSLGMTPPGVGVTDPNCDVSDSSNTEDEEDIYELHDFSRGRGDRSLRSYAEVVNPRPYESRPQVPGDTEDLGGMHRIISRLAERDEIPEEWWASAGLSRNLRPERTT